MSLRDPWSRWTIGTLSLVAAAAAVYAAERLDSAQLAKKSPVTVQISNDKSRKCITVEKPGEGEYVKQFDCNKPGVANQWIKQNSPEAPYFTLKVKYQNRDWCIGVDGGSPLPDAELRLFPCDGKANQKWKMDGARIKNYDQLCIGVNNASVEDRAVLKQFKCDDNSNQKWAWVG
jgi:hypothetical protein